MYVAPEHHYKPAGNMLRDIQASRVAKLSVHLTAVNESKQTSMLEQLLSSSVA